MATLSPASSSQLSVSGERENVNIFNHLLLTFCPDFASIILKYVSFRSSLKEWPEFQGLVGCTFPGQPMIRQVLLKRKNYEGTLFVAGGFCQSPGRTLGDIWPGLREDKIHRQRWIKRIKSSAVLEYGGKYLILEAWRTWRRFRASETNRPQSYTLVGVQVLTGALRNQKLPNHNQGWSWSIPRHQAWHYCLQGDYWCTNVVEEEK